MYVNLKLKFLNITFKYIFNYLSCLYSLSLHPLCGGGDLLFLPSPPASAATCFCSHSKTPTQIISKYFQYAYWPWGICLVIFFYSILALFSSFWPSSKFGNIVIQPYSDYF